MHLKSSVGHGNCTFCTKSVRRIWYSTYLEPHDFGFLLVAGGVHGVGALEVQHLFRRLPAQLVGGDAVELVDLVQQHGRLSRQVLPLQAESPVVSQRTRNKKIYKKN